jgi:hypothetical protein
MKITRALFALLVSMLLASVSFAAEPLFAAEPVFPPGSRIGLVPPDGMVLSAAFQGFEDRARGAMLVLSEFSAQSFPKAEKEFSPERMQASGMEMIARETIALPSGPALVVGARQSENGVLMRKWALLTLEDDITVMVIAALPDAAKDVYPDTVLRAALASVTIRAKLSPDDMLAVLPYRLGELGGFRLLRTSPDGAAVLTLGPKDTTLPAEQPFFMMTPRAVESPQASERDRFAQQMLLAFVSNPNLRIVSSEPVRIAGSQGHEIIAETKDKVTGDDLVMVQWLRFGAGVMQMFGMARKDQWADVLPRMRALRDGLERK